MTNQFFIDTNLGAVTLRTDDDTYSLGTYPERSIDALRDGCAGLAQQPLTWSDTDDLGGIYSNVFEVESAAA